MPRLGYALFAENLWRAPAEKAEKVLMKKAIKLFAALLLVIAAATANAEFFGGSGGDLPPPIVSR